MLSVPVCFVCPTLIQCIVCLLKEPCVLAPSTHDCINDYMTMAITMTNDNQCHAIHNLCFETWQWLEQMLAIIADRFYHVPRVQQFRSFRIIKFSSVLTWTIVDTMRTSNIIKVPYKCEQWVCCRHYTIIRVIGDNSWQQWYNVISLITWLCCPFLSLCIMWQHHTKYFVWY